MLRIPHTLYHDLRQHGEATYPHESCGILLGRREGGARAVEEVVRCVNTRTDSPRDRYHIAPEELVAAQRRARDSGGEIIGFYHSHPDHPPEWSATDLAEAHWVGCSYVITMVERGTACVTRSYALAGTREEDKRFEPEEIEVLR